MKKFFCGKRVQVLNSISVEQGPKLTFLPTRKILQVHRKSTRLNETTAR